MSPSIRSSERDEPSALPFKTGGRMVRQNEYSIFYSLTMLSWILEICASALGAIHGGNSKPFRGTVIPFLVTLWMAFLQTCWMMATAPRHSTEDRIAYLNLAFRLQRLITPTALIGLISWAIGYDRRNSAPSPAYWIIFLVVWITSTVIGIMNVYNNISWEADLLHQTEPQYPQGNFWLGVLGIRSMCRAKYKPEPKGLKKFFSRK